METGVTTFHHASRRTPQPLASSTAQDAPPTSDREEAPGGVAIFRRRASVPTDESAVELTSLSRSEFSSHASSAAGTAWGDELEASGLGLGAASGFHESPFDRADLARQQCDAASKAAGGALEALRQGKLTDEWVNRLDEALKTYKAALDGGLAHDAELRASFESLQAQQKSVHQRAADSPFSLAGMARAQALHADAAATVLRKFRNSSLTEAAAKLSETAKNRREQADKLGIRVLDPAGQARQVDGWSIRLLRAVGLESRAMKIATQRALKGIFHRGPKEIESTVLRALREARQAQPDDAVLRALPLSGWDRLLGKDRAFVKAQLKAAGGLELNRRELEPTIQRTVLLPARSGHAQVVCTQTEGSALTDALAASYAKDGIARSNCHDIAQPLHARTLFHSRMTDGAGKEMLSLIRHGVLSASAFTAKGVKKVSADELGAAVKKMNTQAAGIEFQSMSDRAAGEYLKAVAKTRHGKQLLNALRGIANEYAAREAAAAAVSALAPDELARIHTESAAGKTPSVRLTSVSALTPDRFRKGATSDERRMWADQYAAWQAVRGEQTIQVPVLDADGNVQRDEQGRAMTQAVRVKLEVAAFNFAVNEFATRSVSTLDAVSGCEFAKPANDEAMEMLLGKDFRAKAGSSDWLPGGWLGESLQLAEDPADWTRHQQSIVELAKQVATMYTLDNYVGAGKDPYAMVSRLLVLGQEASRPLLNCKSGKDRTTEGETQGRALAFDVAQAGVLPSDAAALPKPHQRHPDGAARERLWTLHQAGGGRVVQERATGYSGTKLKHPTVFQQYGFNDKGMDKLACQMAYMGASHMVSS